MFLTILDLFLFDLIDDDDTSFDFDNGLMTDDADSELLEDTDTASLLLLFFLGGSDIDEPYTELSTILTCLQFLDYFDPSEVPFNDS
jgi:hypothetical protein